MLSVGDRDDRDWWAGLCGDESFLAGHRREESLPGRDADDCLEDEDYPPALTRWKWAGAAPCPKLTTWPDWPLPPLGGPRVCQWR